MPKPYKQVNVWYGGGGLVSCHLPKKYFQNKGMNYTPECIEPLQGTFLKNIGDGKALIEINHSIEGEGEDLPFRYPCKLLDESGFVGYDDYAWSPKPVLKSRFQLLKIT
jgi:hypothetical protein